MTKKFNLYLTGHALDGHDRAAAAAALARLVRLSEAQAADLLSGRETLVKQNLDEALALQYLRALEQAGVGGRMEGIPAAEALQHPAAPALADETMACPACGAIQPKRTLCRQCGVDMPRMIAARENATRKPATPADAQIARQEIPAMAMTGELPAYRRSRLFEILLFLLVTMLWGYLAMTDRTRKPAMRVFGGVMLAVFGIGTFNYLHDSFSGDDGKREAVRNANIYAAGVADIVSDHALAKQSLPDDSVGIGLPPYPPGAVDAVSIGPAGRVRVKLRDELSSGGKGSITYSPYVEGSKLKWTCATENISTKYLSKDCG